MILDLKQNTPEWESYRENRIGASDCATICGCNPWKSAHRLWKEKLGLIDRECNTVAMQRGHDLEPMARACFIAETGIIVDPVVMRHDAFDWMLASLDGYSAEDEILVEIKCPGAKTIALAQEGIIPLHYQVQIQHQFAVSGLKDGFYYCFDGDQGIAICIKRDEEMIERLIEAEKRFYQALISMEPLDEWN